MKQNESNPEKFSARKIFSWQFAFAMRSAREKAWRTAGSDSRTLFLVEEALPNRMQFAFTKQRAPQKAWRTAGSDSRTFLLHDPYESNAVRLCHAIGTQKGLANCGFRFPYAFLLHYPYESNAVRLRQAKGTRKGLANCGFRFPYAFLLQKLYRIEPREFCACVNFLLL